LDLEVHAHPPDARIAACGAFFGGAHGSLLVCGETSIGLLSGDAVKRAARTWLSRPVGTRVGTPGGPDPGGHGLSAPGLPTPGPAPTLAWRCRRPCRGCS